MGGGRDEGRTRRRERRREEERRGLRKGGRAKKERGNDGGVGKGKKALQYTAVFNTSAPGEEAACWAPPQEL